MTAPQSIRPWHAALRLGSQSRGTVNRSTVSPWRGPWRGCPLLWGLALFSACVLSIGHTCLAADDPAAAAAIRAARPDPVVAALLRKVEQQVAEGHDMSPPKDNAMETWQLVIDKMPYPVSADFARALADFIADVKQQSVQELAAKNQIAAYDLLTFADLADGQLKYFHNPEQSTTALAETAMQPVPQQSTASPATAPKAGAGQEQAGIHSAVAVDAVQPPAGSAADPKIASETPPRVRSAGIQNVAVAAAPAVTHPSVTPAPVTQAPGMHPPVADAPVTQASITQPLATQAPFTQAPFTQAPVAQAPVTHSAFAVPASQAALYVSRGDQMLAIKDVSAARKFFEYGADAGSSVAAADLAKTYDPLFLGRLGVAGLQPDLEQARKWYRKAATLGDADSQARLRTLSEQVSR